MDTKTYLTEPDHTISGYPKGVPYIVGNEAAERFSYYGMRAILYVYVVALVTSKLQLAPEMAANRATEIVHLFFGTVYALPLIGAVIADRWAGKYSTIVTLSWVYCLGHAVLSMTEGTFWGLYLGLGLIAIGAGGIKPCVSAHVGDQFGKSNSRLLERIFMWFYFSINFGSTFSTLLIPYVRGHYGDTVAFAIPGVLMLLATVVFWMGRNVFVHMPPKPGGRLGVLDTVTTTLLMMPVLILFAPFHISRSTAIISAVISFIAGLVVFQYRQSIKQDDGFLAVMIMSLKGLIRREPVPAPLQGRSPVEQHWLLHPAARQLGVEAAEGTMAVWRIVSVFALVSVFWALFDQHASSWVRQAEMMYRPMLWGNEPLRAEQVSSINPILVMILVPALMYGGYPLVGRFVRVTPLRKMTAGMAIASAAFVAVALLQQRIDAAAQVGETVHVGWQLGPYLLMTLSEVLVSITGLEFAYSQAPKRYKSTIMSFWLLSVSFGNLLVALLARFGDLKLAEFFWVFAALMGAAAVLFGIRAALYQTRDYTHAG